MTCMDVFSHLSLHLLLTIILILITVLISLYLFITPGVVFLFSPFIVAVGGGTLWHLQRILQCINYNIFEFTPSITPLYSSSLDSLFSYNFFFLLCAGWGYIVAFTKVLTIYQIHHS
jgi:hypothetical protein